MKPKKILILNTLEVRSNFLWNDRFDGKHLMHGRLRTASTPDDLGVLDYIKSVFRKSPIPPLTNEKYYVLTLKGEL